MANGRVKVVDGAGHEMRETDPIHNAFAGFEDTDAHSLLAGRNAIGTPEIWMGLKFDLSGLSCGVERPSIRSAISIALIFLDDDPLACADAKHIGHVAVGREIP